MLLREKIIVLVFVLGAYVYLFDQTTPYGDRYLENKTVNTSRYAVMQKGKVGYINFRGRLVIPSIYDDGAAYSAGDFILTKKGSAWGFIDQLGDDIIPFNYFWAKEFSQGLAAVGVQTTNRIAPFYGYINTHGKETIPFIYDQVRSFTSDGLAAVKKDSLWGYVNIKGDIVIPSQFQDARDFYHGMAAIKKKGLWGYINYGGSIVIEPQFQEAGEFSKGVAPVKVNGLWGYINLSGQWTLEPPKFTLAHSLSDNGFGMIEDQGGVGFVDQNLKVILYSGQWSEVRDFSEGLAAVKVISDPKNKERGQWEYIDTHGKVIIPPMFDSAGDFKGGYARVSLNKNDIRRGYVNKIGKMIWDPADWQKSTTFKKNLYQWVFYAFTIYLILFIRYLKRRKELKKSQGVS